MGGARAVYSVGIIRGFPGTPKVCHQGGIGWFDAKRRSAREGFFLQAHVGMEIHLCCLHGFVPQPERDHRAIDAMLKKVHGCGVSKHMRGDVLPFEGGASPCGKMGVLGDKMLDRIATESDRLGYWERPGSRVCQRVCVAKHRAFCRFRTERRATLFPAFSYTTHVRAGSQHDILAVQPNQLGDPQAGLYRDQEKGSVPTPDPSGRL